MNRDFSNSLRISDKGLEAVPDDGARGVSRTGGFGDKKKVLILGSLVAAGALIVAYQFLWAHGPSQAAAESWAGAAGAPAPGGTDLAGVLKQVKADAQNDGEGLSVARVEELVKKFDTYVLERQVPVEQLRVNPFEVVQQIEAKAAPATKAGAKTDAAAAAEAEARKRKIRDAMAKVVLGSVMAVGDKRLAIIGGKLCRAGEVIDGFRVEAIEPEQVTLSSEGEKVTLRLRPNASDAKGE